MSPVAPSTAPCVFRIGGERIGAGPHALARYRERVRPGLLDAHAAGLELARVAVSGGSITRDAPTWLHERLDDDGRCEPVAWLLIGEDIAFPLQPARAGGFWAVTCLSRGRASERTLASRSEQRRARSQRRRARRVRDSRPSRRQGRAAREPGSPGATR